MGRCLLHKNVAIAVLCVIFLFGCGGKSGKFENYTNKADAVIAEYNKLIIRHNDFQDRIRNNEDVSGGLSKLHEDLVRFRKDRIESFIVKDRELKEVHDYLINATKSFDNAIAMYIKSPEKEEAYNELIIKTNEDFKKWQSSLKILGQKYNFLVVAKKAEQDKAGE